MRMLLGVAVLITACANHNETRIQMTGRLFLECNDVALRPLHFVHRDKRRDTHEWALYLAEGCGKAAWCGDVFCRAPQEFELVAAQVSIEAGCPAADVHQIQRQATPAQVAYRLSACGQTYACTVPMEGFWRAEDCERIPSGDPVTCHITAAAPSPPPP